MLKSCAGIKSNTWSKRERCRPRFPVEAVACPRNYASHLLHKQILSMGCLSWNNERVNKSPLKNAQCCRQEQRHVPPWQIYSMHTSNNADVIKRERETHKYEEREIWRSPCLLLHITHLSVTHLHHITTPYVLNSLRHWRAAVMFIRQFQTWLRVTPSVIANLDFRDIRLSPQDDNPLLVICDIIDQDYIRFRRNRCWAQYTAGALDCHRECGSKRFLPKHRPMSSFMAR